MFQPMARSTQLMAFEVAGQSGPWSFQSEYLTADMNLNDLAADVEGGEANNITFGLNWYANDNLRFMFNYIKQDNDQFADADGDYVGADDMDIIGVRFQLLF
jgi:phosphate-selective porin OprO/OprP